MGFDLVEGDSLVWVFANHLLEEVDEWRRHERGVKDFRVDDFLQKTL